MANCRGWVCWGCEIKHQASPAITKNLCLRLRSKGGVSFRAELIEASPGCSFSFISFLHKPHIHSYSIFTYLYAEKLRASPVEYIVHRRGKKSIFLPPSHIKSIPSCSHASTILNFFYLKQIFSFIPLWFTCSAKSYPYLAVPQILPATPATPGTSSETPGSWTVNCPKIRGKNMCFLLTLLITL